MKRLNADRVREIDRRGSDMRRQGEIRGERRLNERGLAFSVWLAIALPAFILVIGLGADLARHATALATARQLAAATARASVQEIELTSEGARLDKTAVSRVARAASSDSYRVIAQETSLDRVKVEVTGSYETLFLGLIGISTLHIFADASATVVPVDTQE